MTENEVVAIKKMIRMDKAIKALRKQLTCAYNAVRSNLFLHEEDRNHAAKEMKKVLDETKDYWRGVRIEDHERVLYGLPTSVQEKPDLTVAKIKPIYLHEG